MKIKSINKASWNSEKRIEKAINKVINESSSSEEILPTQYNLNSS
jgi:hypothetical protein